VEVLIIEYVVSAVVGEVSDIAEDTRCIKVEH